MLARAAPLHEGALQAEIRHCREQAKGHCHQAEEAEVLGGEQPGERQAREEGQAAGGQEVGGAPG